MGQRSILEIKSLLKKERRHPWAVLVDGGVATRAIFIWKREEEE